MGNRDSRPRGQTSSRRGREKKYIAFISTRALKQNKKERAAPDYVRGWVGGGGGGLLGGGGCAQTSRRGNGKEEDARVEEGPNDKKPRDWQEDVSTSSGEDSRKERGGISIFIP